jgi:excisionase family DNA binding protein
MSIVFCPNPHWLDPSPVSEPESDVMNVDDVAEFLDVSTARVYEMCQRDEIPFRRVGKRHLRFSRSALLNWLGNRP